MRCAVYRLDNGLPFIADADLIENPDGSVSFWDRQAKRYAGQEPGAYGVRNDNSDKKQYQRAHRDGGVVTFLPEDAHPPCVYVLGTGQVYPS